MTRQAPLGEFEQLILLAAVRLGDQAYGASIRREVETRTGRSVARGAVYTTLDRLEAKHLLESAPGAASDGRAHRRYYEVTSRGIDRLREAAAAVRSLWSGLESVLGER